MKKNKIATCMLVLTLGSLAIIPSITTSAVESITGGYANADKDASIQTRETVSAGGGTWTYGRDGQWCISYYNHNSLRHRATAINGNGAQHQTEWMPATVWARASIIATTSGNQAFWDTRTN